MTGVKVLERHMCLSSIHERFTQEHGLGTDQLPRSERDVLDRLVKRTLDRGEDRIVFGSELEGIFGQTISSNVESHIGLVVVSLGAPVNAVGVALHDTFSLARLGCDHNLYDFPVYVRGFCELQSHVVGGVDASESSSFNSLAFARHSSDVAIGIVQVEVHVDFSREEGMLLIDDES